MPDISNWLNEDIQNIKNLIINEKYKFDNDKFHYVTNKNINIGKNLAYMFYDCSNLEKLPDISNWKMDNVVNVKGLFSGCSSLSSLPDISKWNISNITDISELFSNCSSLLSLPDLSKWDTSKVSDMSYLFSYCSSISTLPDISNWNTKNNFGNIFAGCKSLVFFPNILKWNNNSELNMNINLFQSSSFSSKDLNPYLLDITSSNINVQLINSNSDDIYLKLKKDIKHLSEKFSEKKYDSQTDNNTIINNYLIHKNEFNNYELELNDYYENFYNI